MGNPCCAQIWFSHIRKAVIIKDCVILIGHKFQVIDIIQDAYPVNLLAAALTTRNFSFAVLDLPPDRQIL